MTLPTDDNLPPGASERTPLLDTECANTAPPNNYGLNEPDNRQLAWILSGACIAAFLAALDSTLIATLAVPIADAFDSLTLLAWLAAAYLIANAVSQPLAGQWTDVFGRRRGMMLANLLFGLGNLLCGAASSPILLIVGRVIAGLGGGGIGPIATFVASDLIPLRRRGLWQGLLNLCFGVGSGLGGPLGGLIHDHLGWRWAFYLQIPFTIIAMVLVWGYMEVPTQPALNSTSEAPDSNTSIYQHMKSRWARIDYRGSLLLGSALVFLLIGINAGGNEVPWQHPLVAASVTLSAVLLSIFVWVERRAEMDAATAAPVIPIRLLGHRTVAAACLANWLVSAARFGLLFYVPVFFLVQGYSASATGARLIPESISIGVTAVAAGALMQRTGRYYSLGMAAALLISIGLIIPVATFDTRTPLGLVILCLVLVGAGYSGMLSVTLIALIAAVDHQYQAVITSASYAFRSTGSSLGIALAAAVFQNTLQNELAARTAHLDRDGLTDDLEMIWRRVRNNLEVIDTLPPVWRTAVRAAYQAALRMTFGVLMCVGFVGAATMLLMREHRLWKTLDRGQRENGGARGDDNQRRAQSIEGEASGGG